MGTLSLSKDKIKILLLEGVHQNAVDIFKANGYENIDYHKKAVDEDKLIDIIKDVHFLGIRSRTQVNSNILKAAKKLIGVGCFCIGTNQIDLVAARNLGIAVFNAPYSNTRSVAELVIGEIILLLRGIPEKNYVVHNGGWNKSAANSYEARGKILGIVGYGSIGSQLSILAESLGMKVVYHDISTKLPLGNARQLSTLDEVLEIADIVTIHVPDTKETRNFFTKEQFSKMKKNSIFINAARGTCVVIEDLVEALASKHIIGAAIDVFPKEPKGNDEEFVSKLREFQNVILTPHIGGSTIEAQANIGIEVASKLINYSDEGSTITSVNFPEVSLPKKDNAHRILHIHRNVPGVLSQVNSLFSNLHVNIVGQTLMTKDEIGYLIVDLNKEASIEVLESLKEISETIKVRVLF